MPGRRRPRRDPTHSLRRSQPLKAAAFVPTERVPLAPLSTLGVGGAARHYARVESVEALAAGLAWAAARGLPVFVLGGGSNLVVADAGWPGLVLHVALAGLRCEPVDGATRVVAAAGEPWDGVVAAAVARGLAGLECLSGIPGSAGGTPIQNVGAYGQEVADTLESVTAFDRRSSRVVELAAADCGFAYRMSRFKREDAERFVVCAVTFRLAPGAPTVKYPDLARALAARAGGAPTLAAVRDAVIAVRRGKGMVVDAADPDSRSVGSFFMNPVVDAEVHAHLAATHAGPVPGFAAGPGKVKVPAAWLIEQAGFAKGHAAGAVGLSTKHPLALVNRGGATAREVVAFACQVKRTVDASFGIALCTEPVFVGLDGDPDVEYLRQAAP